MDRQNSEEPWRITYHFVWSPMRSKPCLVGEVAKRLQDLVEERAEVLAFEPRAVVVLPDRVYLAVVAPPTLAPHHIICSVKALTSRVLRDEFPELTRIPTLWTRTYLVLAGESITAEEVFRRYEALLPARRPRGRPRKAQSTPEGHSSEGQPEWRA